MPDQLVGNPVTGLFPVVFCALCQVVRTQHRCLAVVTRGGVRYGQQVVCGLPICGPCNASYNDEEHITRCEEHTEEKENEEPEPKTKSKHKQPKAAESKAKATKAAEYTAKDLLVLSQAYIRTSENAIEGTAQKRNKFWDDVAEAFKVLKKHQEDYDKRVQKKKKYNKIMLRGEFLSSDSEDEVEIIVPARTASSLQQKWSKFVMPYVTKFIGLTTRHPKLSGEGKSLCFPSCFSICCYLTSMFLIVRQRALL
jgi:hypothetical protein